MLCLPITPADATSDVCYCLPHDVIKGNLKEEQRQDAALPDVDDNFKEDTVAGFHLYVAAWTQALALENWNKSCWKTLIVQDTSGRSVKFFTLMTKPENVYVKSNNEQRKSSSASRCFIKTLKLHSDILSIMDKTLTLYSAWFLAHNLLCCFKSLHSFAIKW